MHGGALYAWARLGAAHDTQTIAVPHAYTHETVVRTRAAPRRASAAAACARRSGTTVLPTREVLDRVYAIDETDAEEWRRSRDRAAQSWLTSHEMQVESAKPHAAQRTN